MNVYSKTKKPTAKFLPLMIGSSLLTLGLSLHVFGLDYVPGELIVKTKTKLAPVAQKNFSGKMTSKGLSFKSSFGKMQTHQFKLNPQQDMQAMIRELEKDPDIEYAEPNYIIRKTEVPTDKIQPLSYQQMADSITTLSNGNYSQSSAPTGVNEAWASMNPDETNRPIVAILDTGIDYNHQVLVDSHALWINVKEVPDNGIDDDQNGYIDDVNGWNFYAAHHLPWDDDGHGTHVAGIVAGLSFDIFENPVAQSKIQVMGLKFLGADGSGDTAAAVRAIDYAIANGARVINASWGGSAYSRSLHEAFSRAYAAGLLVVTAAGNSGSNNDSTPIYPANLSLPGLLSVAASNSWDNLASFSNYGVNTVHLAAPGVTIGSTYPNSFFGYSSGTSMAAPFVSGVAALMLRESPHLTGYQLKELILSSVTASENFSQKIYTSGRVNVLAALNAAKNLATAEAFLPAYTLSMPDRSIASENTDGSTAGANNAGGGGGCGTLALVRGLKGNNSDSGPGGGSMNGLSGILVLFLPALIWLIVRRKEHSDDLSNSLIDGRLSQRVEVKDTILVKTRQGQFEASLRNISQGGLAFAFNGRRVSLNEDVSFIISGRDGKEKIEIAGKIAWTNDSTMAGVKFQSVSNYLLSFLSRTYAN